MSVLGGFERLGGTLVRPRTTLRSIVWGGEGSLYEPLALFILASIIAAPAQAGRAILFLRVSVGEGLSVFANLLAERLWPPAAGAFGAALVLWLVIRARGHAEGPPFGRLVDAGFYLMLPYAVLVAGGAVLAHFGWDFWFMPHRLPRGGPSTVLARLVVAYLPSLGLVSWIAAGPLAPSEAEPEHE